MADIYCSYEYSYKEKTISRGKPTAIIKGISEEDFEDYLLENNPKFLAALAKAREEYMELGGISIDEYLKKRKSRHG